jgi:hypothetical protein
MIAMTGQQTNPKVFHVSLFPQVKLAYQEMARYDCTIAIQKHQS